jgi:hypothetical protein
MIHRIILAAGHGGGDVGATGQGTTEAAEVIQIVNRAAQKFRVDGQVEVVVVPHELGLIDEINWVNARYKNLDDALCIEVHKNSTANAHGIEAWYWGGDAASKSLAEIVLAGIMSVDGMPVSRGVKGDNTNRWGSLGWIRETNPWALLLEMGFVSDGGDGVDDASDDRYAEGIFRGVLAAFGLSPKPAPAPAPAPAPVPAKPAPIVMVKYKVYDSAGKQIGAYNTESGAWNKYLTGGTKIVETATGNDVTGVFVNKYRAPVPNPPTANSEPHPVYDPAKDTEQDKRLDTLEAAVEGLKVAVKAVGDWLANTFKNWRP